MNESDYLKTVSELSNKVDSIFWSVASSESKLEKINYILFGILIVIIIGVIHFW